MPSSWPCSPSRSIGVSCSPMTPTRGRPCLPAQGSMPGRTHDARIDRQPDRVGILRGLLGTRFPQPRVPRLMHDILALFRHSHSDNKPAGAINGRIEALRGSTMSFANITSYIQRRSHPTAANLKTFLQANLRRALLSFNPLFVYYFVGAHLPPCNRRKTPEPWVPGFGGGGCEIRTREAVTPTRFPSVRHRPLGESSTCTHTTYATQLE